LGSKQFIRVTGGGCPGYVDESAHPDFSDDGSTIEFGFFRANSQIDGQMDYSMFGGIDNWHVAIYPFRYAAMGDSFSSGEGADDYLPGTDRSHQQVPPFAQRIRLSARLPGHHVG
jgi:hypothetical protein